MKYKITLQNITENNLVDNKKIIHVCICNDEWISVGKKTIFITEINTERRLEIYSINLSNGTNIYSCRIVFEGNNKPKIIAFEAVDKDTWIKRLVTIEKI